MTDVTELHNGRMALRGVGKMKSKRWPQSYQVGPPIKTSVNSLNTSEPFAEILAEDKWGLAVYKAHSASVWGGNMDVCVAFPLIFSCSQNNVQASLEALRVTQIRDHFQHQQCYHSRVWPARASEVFRWKKQMERSTSISLDPCRPLESLPRQLRTSPDPVPNADGSHLVVNPKMLI